MTIDLVSTYATNIQWDMECQIFAAGNSDVNLRWPSYFLDHLPLNLNVRVQVDCSIEINFWKRTFVLSNIINCKNKEIFVSQHIVWKPKLRLTSISMHSSLVTYLTIVSISQDNDLILHFSIPIKHPNGYLHDINIRVIQFIK